MSSNNTIDPFVQEVIAQLPDAVVARYTELCAAVLLLYDYFLTFPLESRHIWQGKMNIMKVSFILGRYSSILSLYSGIIIDSIKAETNTECQVFYYINEIFNSFSVFAISCIFTLRTYAIYGRSRVIFFLLAIPAFVAWSLGIWGIVAQTPVALPSELQISPLACSFNQASSLFSGSSSSFCYLSHRKAVEVINFVCTAVFDVLVVILTVSRTGRLALQSRKVGISGSLSFIMARDGMVYYSAIFVPHFVAIALYAIVLKTGNDSLSDVSDSLAGINNALEVILVNRLVLNLCHAANPREGSEFRVRTGLEPPTFTAGPVLGNIGASVRTVADEMDDEMFDGEERVDDANAEGITVTAEPPVDANEAGSLNGIIEFRHDTGVEVV